MSALDSLSRPAVVERFLTDLNRDRADCLTLAKAEFSRLTGIDRMIAESDAYLHLFGSAGK